MLGAATRQTCVLDASFSWRLEMFAGQGMDKHGEDFSGRPGLRIRDAGLGSERKLFASHASRQCHRARRWMASGLQFTSGHLSE
jgi:hypothetical protein